MANINDLADAMASFEGSSASDLNHRNNNPGNLVYVGQTGATLGEGGFAKFSSWQAGLDAMTWQLGHNLIRGTNASGQPTTTLSEMIAGWANRPSDQGALPNYISTVANKLGINPNESLASQLGFHKG